jgi:hypothetical protein
MMTHELAALLLSRTDAVVSDTLADRLLNKPAGKATTGACWCGCGGQTKGRFVPGHDARFHSLAKKVARGQEEAPESFVCDAAEEDFLKWFTAEEAVLAAKKPAATTAS